MFLRNLVWYAGGKQQKIEGLVKVILILKSAPQIIAYITKEKS